MVTSEMATHADSDIEALELAIDGCNQIYAIQKDALVRKYVKGKDLAPEKEADVKA